MERSSSPWSITHPMSVEHPEIDPWYNATLILSASVGSIQFSLSKTDKQLNTMSSVILTSSQFLIKKILGFLSASTTGVTASCLWVDFRLPSWFPKIIYVGAIAARLVRKFEHNSKYSGDRFVFVWAISPPI